jgi:hypothetical protein
MYESFFAKHNLLYTTTPREIYHIETLPRNLTTLHRERVIHTPHATEAVYRNSNFSIDQSIKTRTTRY